ncbi:uncharacterized protein LOC127136750 [Lathyrus oleraceus]|uniref:uncharacterized protein LOC127136750 n=1 Tax=Pisum sativum TaxID=3888 RepID=UPI0021D176CD|nr:uncharacterized protein LOC127136750 [Pisum sativum]
MPLSNTSIAALRQQMDDNNHELVNMLTNQMGTVFNPVIHESAETNRQMANQLTRLCNFLGAPARQTTQVVRQTIHVQVETRAAEDETVHEGQILRPQQNQGVESGVAGRNQMVNGMSATLQRPLYASPLAEFILQIEAPGGMKMPKYTKFGGESGHSKISLAELSSIKRRFAESIDEHLNRFRSLKGRCFTQVPEHELVQMAAGGLDYSIRKKIDSTFVKSMSQLANRVRHLERLRLEKVRHSKAKKEKIAFVDYDATYPINEVDYASSTELEIDVAELKPESSYECQLLFPAQGKNHVENNPKFPSKKLYI